MQRQLPTPPDETAANPDSLVPVDPRRILGILRRRAALILLVTIVATGVAAAFAYRPSTLYQSTAVIRLRDAREAVTGGLAGEAEQLSGPMLDPMQSLIEVLASRGVAGAVVDSMPLLRLRTHGFAPTLISAVSFPPNLATDSLHLEFWEAGVRLEGAAADRTVPYGSPLATTGLTITPARRPEAFQGMVELVPREAAIDGLLANLKVETRPGTDVINVQYTAADPELARIVATRVVEVFRAADADMARQQSRARRVFLESQLQQAEADLATARSELASFRTSERAYSARDRFASEQAGLSALQVRREDLDAQRRLYRTLLARLAQPGQPGDGLGALLSSPGLTDNPVIRQIADQLARYEGQRDSLTTGQWSSASSNPDVQRLNELIAGARTRLTGAVRSVVSVLDARIASLDATQRRELASFRQLSSSEERETELTENAESSRRMAAELRTEYQRARLAEAVDVGKVEVIDLAGPARPIGTSPVLIVLFGVVAGLIAGCVAALVTEYLTPSIRRQDELAATLGTAGPVVIPRTIVRNGAHGELSNGSRALVTMADPGSGGAEAYRALRTTLLFAQEAAGVKSLMVTSAMPGEGKTTVASNLAVVFAQQGVNVLLVDCDLRRSRLHHLFHVQRTPGLTTLLAGAVRPEAAIRSTGVKHLAFLPSGAAPPNPAELIGGAEMAATVEYLVGEFDMVIFDSPPLLSAADASILATLTEGVVMVVRAGKLAEEVVRLAQQQLTTVGARIIAAVLNDPDSEVKRYGGEYYFAGYATEQADEQ
jgi:tyrosine-protein kinase Etk/Wzc